MSAADDWFPLNQMASSVAILAALRQFWPDTLNLHVALPTILVYTNCFQFFTRPGFGALNVVLAHIKNYLYTA